MENLDPKKVMCCVPLYVFDTKSQDGDRLDANMRPYSPSFAVHSFNSVGYTDCSSKRKDSDYISTL